MNDDKPRLSLVSQQAQNDIASHQSDADDQIDLLQVLLTLWRGKWFILLCAIIATSIGAYYALKVAAPQFSATTQLVLQVNNQQVVDIESVVSGASSDDASLNTELQIIQSRTLVLELIRAMNLSEDPEFNVRLQAAPAVSLDRFVEMVRSLFGLTVPEAPTPSQSEIELEVATVVQKAISATFRPNTYVIEIRAKTGNPSKSGEMAHRLAEIYLEDQVRVKFAETEFAVNWLSERVTQLEMELNQKEDQIKDLRAETELVSLEALEALGVRAKDIRQRLSETNTEIAQETEKAAHITALLAAQDFAGIAERYSVSTLDRLAARISAGDADAVSEFSTRVDVLQKAAADNISRLLSQRDALQASFNFLQEQIGDQSSDLVALNQLIREADATKVLYETFLARLKETTVQIGLQRADSRILSGGIPGEQVAPRKALILAMALILGVLSGVGIVLLRSLSQQGFRSAEELERVTGYSVLGQIPIFPIRRRLGLLDYLRTKPTSAAAEAIRNLRTSILLSNVDKPPQIIMSTSSVPGEGKTTQSISLAQNLSGLGKKVLLIEGDIRRRTFEQYFKTTPKGNLVSVVAGEIDLSEAVISDDGFGADVLMGGKSAINAADLFSSEKLRDFIATVREAYDFVIIDTPPVLVVPDARVIGHHVDAIVFAVKWNQTNQFQVVDGLRQLSSVGLRVSGLVLSQIDPRGMKRYGYGGRYGAYSSYGQDYYDA